MWRSRIAASLFVVGMVSGSFVGEAEATVVGCQTASSGAIHLNYCRNHGYFAESERYSLAFSAEALDLLRSRLVAVGHLEELPVVFEVPAFSQPEASLELTDHCTVETGDMEVDTPTVFARCYRVRTGEHAIDYPSLRTMLVGLSRVSSSGQLLPIPDLQRLDRDLGASQAPFSGMRLDSRRHPAPAGPSSVVEVWVDGFFRHELVVGTTTHRQLAALSGFPIGAPRWSPDGRWVAMASLREVLVYDSVADTHHRFDVVRHLGGDSDDVTFDVRIRWDPQARPALEITADEQMRSDYHHWRWTPSTGDVAVLSTDLSGAPFD